jgi:hypothetical protein
MPLEVLHFAFMFLGTLKRIESAQVPAFAGFGVRFARVQAVFTGFEFADHSIFLRRRARA